MAEDQVGLQEVHKDHKDVKNLRKQFSRGRSGTKSAGLGLKSAGLGMRVEKSTGLKSTGLRSVGLGKKAGLSRAKTGENIQLNLEGA